MANDEPELLKLIGDVLDLANGREVTWAIDMTGGEPALLLALRVNHGQEALCTPGRLVNRASDGYRGEGKTDARACSGPGAGPGCHRHRTAQAADGLSDSGLDPPTGVARLAKWLVHRKVRNAASLAEATTAPADSVAQESACEAAQPVRQSDVTVSGE